MTVSGMSDEDLQRAAEGVVELLVALPESLEENLPMLAALQAEIDARRVGRERFRDVGQETAYGRTVALSSAVRCF